MKKIYESLYIIGNQDENLQFSEKAAKVILGSNPKKLDLLAITHLENMDFIEALYMGVFNRVMEETAQTNWKKYSNLSKEEFQRRAVTAVTTSEEYICGSVEIINNVYKDGNIIAYNIGKIKSFFLSK